MGYRSEIAIAIHKDVIGEFLTFLKTTSVMAAIFGEYGFTLDKDFQGDGHWLFTDTCKWYTGDKAHYADVYAFEDFFTLMDADGETEEKYRFIRVGEESGDVEERGQWYDSDLWVKREIAVGW